jgi:RNA polymerase sigma-70 factor (ECF subfamily)
MLVQGEVRRLDPERSGDHIDALFRAACAMCGSRQLADDLGYLVKALRNTWYSHLRSERGRREATAGDAAPEELPVKNGRGDPEASLEATTVLDAVAELPVQYREVVTAVDVAGLSYAEAARALGVRQGTVMSRLYRGREQVALALSSD